MTKVHWKDLKGQIKILAFIKIDSKEHNRLEEMWMDPKEKQPFEDVLKNSLRIKSWQKKK